MAKTSAAKVAEQEKPKVVGKVEMKKLDAVTKNPWNPNRMTDFERESLKTGLKTDGWLSSQALLVWGTDEKGKTKNLIIDGEHRWTVAQELGFVQGPMVFLFNLPEAQAKALTVKMNAKRGKFQDELLAPLLKSIEFELGVPDLSLDIGIQQEELMKLLAFEPEVIPLGDDERPPVEDSPDGPPPQMQQGHVNLVQLFYSKEQHTEFSEAVEKISAKHGSKNISEAVLAAVRVAAEE